MKTTVEISDNLLRRTRQVAREANVTLRALVEEGLELVLRRRTKRTDFKASPVTCGGEGLSPRFRGAAWDRIREAAYDREQP